MDFVRSHRTGNKVFNWSELNFRSDFLQNPYFRQKVLMPDKSLKEKKSRKIDHWAKSFDACSKKKSSN